MSDTTTPPSPDRDLIIADAFTSTGGYIEHAQQMHDKAAADVRQVLDAGRAIPDVGDLAECRHLLKRCHAVRDLARSPEAHHSWLAALQATRAEAVADLARLNLASPNPHARAVAESQAHADGRFLRQTAYLLNGV